MNDKKFKRQCASCREIKNKEDLIKITKNFETNEIQLNQQNEIQGRSVYLCKNEQCIEKAFKKNRIEVLLKSKAPENLKLEVYTVLKK